MRKFRYALFSVSLILVGVTHSLASEAQGPALCERDLEAAEVMGQQAHGGEESLHLYEAAFQRCDGLGDELSPELQARVTGAKARVAHLFRNEVNTAIRLYEEGLVDSYASLSSDSPLRIELLDGLAFALESRARSDQGRSAIQDQARSIQAREEALSVRRQIFGDESPEAARGLVLLGFSHLPAKPHLAEKYIKEAVAIIDQGAETPLEIQGEAYSALAEVYRLQGQRQLAEDASERAGEILSRAHLGETNL